MQFRNCNRLNWNIVFRQKKFNRKETNNKYLIYFILLNPLRSFSVTAVQKNTVAISINRITTEQQSF